MCAEERAKKEIPKIPIIFPDNIKGGVYSNLMYVRHTPEEFIMDFAMVVAPQGAITARVIMSPGHMKRTISALQNNLKKYEEEVRTVAEAPAPPAKEPMGFLRPKEKE